MAADSSNWDCPCEVEELEEWIVDDNWNCDVCEKEFPSGSTFWGNRDEDWDICDYCYHGKEVPKTAFGTEDAENITQEEKQKRMDKLNRLNAQRIVEKEVAVDRKHQMTLDPTDFTLLKVGMRVAAYYRDGEGDRSRNVTLASIARVKNESEVEVTYDSGLFQTIPKNWVAPVGEEDEEYLTEQLEGNDKDWTTKIDTPFGLQDIEHSKGTHKLSNLKCKFNCGYIGLKIGVVLHEKRCRRNPYSCLWAGEHVTESVPVGDRVPRIKAEKQPILKKWGAGHRMWQTLPLENKVTHAAFIEPAHQKHLQRKGATPADWQMRQITGGQGGTGKSVLIPVSAYDAMDNNDYVPVSAHKQRNKQIASGDTTGLDYSVGTRMTGREAEEPGTRLDGRTLRSHPSQNYNPDSRQAAALAAGMPASGRAALSSKLGRQHGLSASVLLQGYGDSETLKLGLGDGYAPDPTMHKGLYSNTRAIKERHDVTDYKGPVKTARGPGNSWTKG